MKSAKGSGYPCVEVTWFGAAAFCNYLSEKEGRTTCYDLSNWSCNWSANGYRLPTEAEWERVARGGAFRHRFPWTTSDTIGHGNANYVSSVGLGYDVSPTQGHHPEYKTGGEPYTAPVGSFAPNDFGVYDMAGNVTEWCWDWYGDDYYANSPENNPRGPASGTYRVLRGGAWDLNAIGCRVSGRTHLWPSVNDRVIGFRTVLPLAPQGGAAGPTARPE
jgi:formylglycine-generating enzyme required for sulfatase activity